MYQKPRTRVARNPVEGKPGFQPPPSRPPNSQLANANLAHQTDDRDTASGEVGMRMEGVYIISVAARILDMHPQTLRKYERIGLINPGRTLGMLRLYSREDIRRLRLIQHLVGELGLNLAGVEFALGTVNGLVQLEERLTAASEGTGLREQIIEEISRLFRNLNLPVEDRNPIS